MNYLKTKLIVLILVAVLIGLLGGCGQKEKIIKENIMITKEQKELMDSVIERANKDKWKDIVTPTQYLEKKAEDGSPNTLCGTLVIPRYDKPKIYYNEITKEYRVYLPATISTKYMQTWTTVNLSMIGERNEIVHSLESANNLVDKWYEEQYAKFKKDEELEKIHAAWREIQ